ncbi:MAG: hypothetical protein QF685_09255 [Verrucomicrobiota bacterium]|jgi:hypothetical protein|nr:hypothetical protein [Verrucomicrobiota bacterium]
MKKIILLLTTVAFMAGSFGFVGCSGEVAEDPDAAANAAKEIDTTSDTDDPDKDANDGEGDGEKAFAPKKDPDDPDDEGDEGE